MVETIESMGDALGQVWALFQNESGDLTLLALILLSALALGTAYRSAMATRPAFAESVIHVIVAGSAFTVVFLSVGIFFLVQAIELVL